MRKNRYFIPIFLIFILLNINFSIKQEYDFYRAAVAYKKGEFLKAIKIYSIYKKRFPKNSEYLYNIGTVYLKMGKYDIALKYFKNGLKKTVSSKIRFMILFNTGILFYKTGDLNKALLFFKKSAIINSNNLILKKNLELILKEMQKNNNKKKEIKKKKKPRERRIIEPLLNYVNETEKESVKSFLKKKKSKKEEKYW